jgi:hypothetical protein
LVAVAIPSKPERSGKPSVQNTEQHQRNSSESFERDGISTSGLLRQGDRNIKFLLLTEQIVVHFCFGYLARQFTQI